MKLNTFSIIARCPDTGHLGAAVATCFPGVGAHSPHIEADVGIIVTQGWVNPMLGKKGLQLLKSGKTANETLNRLMLNDPGRELRQIAVLDYYGNTAAYTGIENDEYKGHIIGRNCSVQGNLLTSPAVLEAMLETFEFTEGLLENRLLAALEAGQAAGGDKRGKQSAVIKVEAIDGFPYVDFRVDDHDNPIGELRRIYEKNKHILIDRYHEWVDAVKEGNKL
ncbi:DUF1028 domain-containing protein [Bacillus sp. Marseille-P3661]|uniref:DUF1028 domain-containing protein n=1 Tax=Bacillus sp. Marseille-P3661 TaxID=1936234 RepID=UPI000C866BF4|nr:DUF1028 domain-containing protein [Bacillus sp. Marseille-P3661]